MARSAAAAGKTSTVGVGVVAAVCRVARPGTDSGDDARSPAAGAAVSSDASAVTNPAPSPARCHAKPLRYARSAASETPHPYQSGFVAPDADADAVADSDPLRSRSNRPVVPVRLDCDFPVRVCDDEDDEDDREESVDRDDEDEEDDREVRERLDRPDRDELAVEEEDDACPELDRREVDDREDEEDDREEEDEEDDVADDDRPEADRSPVPDPPEPPFFPAVPGYLNFVRPSRRFSTYVP